MVKLVLSDFAQLCFDIESLQGECLFDPESQTAKNEESRWRTSVSRRLEMMRLCAIQMGLEATSKQAGRISVQAKSGVAIEVLVYLLRDFEQTVVGDLSSAVTLVLRPDLVSFFDHEDKPVFGERVARKLRKAMPDICEARRCFALERWDACVHHLMVATEHALRVWAKALKLRTKKHIDLEEQKAILDAAEAERKLLLNAQKTKDRDNKLKYLSETLGHFGFIKDAYRNYSAHGKEKYTEQKARNLMTHIEAFMTLLAA
jgi:hypothetical protein